MKACPLCHRRGSLLLVMATGFWERHVLSSLGWHPYRCRACGHRIVCRQPRSSERSSSDTAAVSADDSPNAGFLPPQKAQGFDALIRQLEQSEEKQGLRPRRSKGRRSRSR